MRKLIIALLLLSCTVGLGQQFPEKWPQINNWMQASATNLISGGVVTNEPSLGYVQNLGSNAWKIYFPVGGIVTQVITYVPPPKYLNVSGGLLTMSGDPTSGVNVIELVPATLITEGFIKGEGTPESSWLVGLGANPMRLRRDANGFSVRNYADNEYRDLFCRNLSVFGTNNIYDTTTLNVETNRITLNSNVTNGTPVLDAYFSVSRGSSPTASVQWVESTDEWYLGYDGAMHPISYYSILAVSNEYPQIATFDASAVEAVSNAYPWVLAITPAQIHNWDTIHVWSTNQTIDAVTNQWTWIDGWYGTWTNWLVAYANDTNNWQGQITAVSNSWFGSIAYQIQSVDTQRWNTGYNTALWSSNNFANYMPKSGGTFTGRVYTTYGGLSTAPVSNELVTAEWVRNLTLSGQEWHFTTNVISGVGEKTANFVQLRTEVPTNGFTNIIASVTSSNYLAGGISTQLYSRLTSPVTFQIYMAKSGGSPASSVQVHPELYYIYNGTTNQLGDWDVGYQTVSETTPTLYTFTVPFIEPTLTGGVYIVAYLKSDLVSGTPPAVNLSIYGGGLYASHFDIEAVNMGESAAEVQANLDVHTGMVGTAVHGLGTMSLADTGTYYLASNPDGFISSYVETDPNYASDSNNLVTNFVQGANITLTKTGRSLTIASSGGSSGGAVEILFEANMNGGTQVLPANVFTKLNYTNVVYNPDGNYTATNASYTVTKAGWYKFETLTWCSDVTSSTGATCLYTNGVLYSLSGGNPVNYRNSNLVIYQANGGYWPAMKLVSNQVVSAYQVLYNTGITIAGTTNQVRWVGMYLGE